MKGTRVRFMWRDRTAHREFRTGVSLHSHTMHSRENLGFIPRYAAKIPLLAWEIRRLAKKYQVRTGRVLDYTRGHWTPPLPGHAAYELERRHIEQKLGLAAMVSLSDHDNIEAACELQKLDGGGRVPISVEWTLPIGPTFFHIGVHNLPAGSAQSTVADLSRYNRNPTAELRRDLLESMSSRPDTLIVLNHPLWDQSCVGAGTHKAQLEELLADSDGYIHALELNGLRPWHENKAVLDLARASDRVLVSGGDRHACEPSSIVNLTRAASFPEFVAEVRDGRSDVGFLNHYREPLGVRIVKAVCDIMGYYPEQPGRSHWTDRVFCRLYSGITAPLSQVWRGELPRLIHCFDCATQLAGNRKLLRMLRLCCGAGTEMD